MSWSPMQGIYGGLLPHVMGVALSLGKCAQGCAKIFFRWRLLASKVRVCERGQLWYWRDSWRFLQLQNEQKFIPYCFSQPAVEVVGKVLTICISVCHVGGKRTGNLPQKSSGPYWLLGMCIHAVSYENLNWLLFTDSLRGRKWTITQAPSLESVGLLCANLALLWILPSMGSGPHICSMQWGQWWAVHSVGLASLCPAVCC